MNIIDQIEIKGFWGIHSVTVKTFDDFNFIIGANGSGKTTMLNLVAGVLQADKASLSRYEFDSIKITLKEPGSRKKPSIEAIRDNESPFFKVSYKISENASDKPFTYEISDLENFDNFSSSAYQIRMRLAGRSAASKTLRKHLDELVSLTWLSVQRINGSNENSAEPLDNKLDDISNRLVRYLSAIGKQVNRLYEGFQEQVFLSLLSGEKVSENIIPSPKKIEKDKTTLLQIFAQFQIDKNNYDKKIDKHFKAVETLQSKIKSSDELSPSEIMTIFDLQRIERSVDFWEYVTLEKNKLLASREKFLALLNKLMQRKTITLTERNEITIKTQSGKILTPQQLSSGEKQILIILAEALLQEGRTYIYMADEPELSLHIDWQEKLASNIKSLNPSAQIIFATHSPDVVGQFQDQLTHMENCIK